MRKQILSALALAGAFFCVSFPAHAQSPVAVTGDTEDPIGIPYSNSTVSILLIPSGTNPTVGGAAISGTNNGIADINGRFNVSLYKNSDISPGGSRWQFTICETPGIQPPLGTGGQCFSITVNITAAVDLSATLDAAAKALTAITLGAGSVTNIATTAPITGGPITTTGTIACATCVTGPGGANTQVQYNNSGAFAGAAGIIYTLATTDTTIQNTLGNAFKTNDLTHGGDPTIVNADGTTLDVGPANIQLLSTGGVTTMAIFQPNLATIVGTIALSDSLRMSGLTSGGATLGVASVAGTPARINLPTATGVSGQCFTTNGATPQQTSWASCGGGITTVTFSATPTFAAATASSFIITLTGNVTSSTLTGPTAGQELTFIICQDGVGGRTFVPPAGFTDFVTISPIASVCTNESFVWDGAAARITGVSTNGGPAAILAEQAAPITPVSGFGYVYDDSTNHILSFKNPSGVVSNTVVGIANPSDTKAINYTGVDGVQNRIQVIVPAGGAPGGTMTGQFTVFTGSAAAPGLVFSSTRLTTGFYNFANDFINFSENGIDTFQISAPYMKGRPTFVYGWQASDIDHLASAIDTSISRSAAGIAAFGTSVNFGDTTGSWAATSGIFTESTAPSSPAAGFGKMYDDSTNHIFSFKNPSGVVSSTIVGIANPSDSSFVNYVGVDGVQHRTAGPFLGAASCTTAGQVPFTSAVSGTLACDAANFQYSTGTGNLALGGQLKATTISTFLNTGNIGFNASTAMYAPANGVLRITNNADNSVTSLQLGPAASTSGVRLAITFQANPIIAVQDNNGGTTALLKTPALIMTNLLLSATAPTVSSGFGTGASVTANNGTAALRINVGTSNTGNGIILLPAATTGWNCFATDLTTKSAAVSHTLQVGVTSTTLVTLQNYTDLAVTGAWVDSDVLSVSCFAF